MSTRIAVMLGACAVAAAIAAVVISSPFAGKRSVCGANVADNVQTIANVKPMLDAGNAAAALITVKCLYFADVRLHVTEPHFAFALSLDILVRQPDPRYLAEAISWVSFYSRSLLTPDQLDGQQAIAPDVANAIAKSRLFFVEAKRRNVGQAAEFLEMHDRQFRPRL